MDATGAVEMNSPTCLVVFPYDCHASGGIRNAAVGLVRTLVHAGCPVDVASPRSGNPFEGKTTELGGAKVRAFHYYERGCRDMAEHIAPDVDFIFLWWCTGDSARFAETAKKRGLPYLWYSGGVFQCRSVIKYPFQIAYLNFSGFAKSAAAFVVPTISELSQARRILPTFKEKAICIPHEIPPAVGKPPIHVSTSSIATVGYLGRIDINQKGLDILVKAVIPFASEQKCRLVIGGPDYHGGIAELKRLIPPNLLKKRDILFSGPVYGAAKDHWFDMIDVYIQASRYEGFGITIAEAMQRGKPLILSRKCNIAAEVIAAGAGFGCQPRVGSVRSAIETALRTPPEELRRMGEAGRRWVEGNCNIDVVTEKTMRLIQAIAQR